MPARSMAAKRVTIGTTKAQGRQALPPVPVSSTSTVPGNCPVTREYQLYSFQMAKPSMASPIPAGKSQRGRSSPALRSACSPA